MNDTTDAARAEFRKRLSATDSAHRLQMMAGMFSVAKLLARASLGDSVGDVEPGLGELFRRIYRADFDEDELAAIAEHLDAAQGAAGIIATDRTTDELIREIRGDVDAV